VESLFSPSGIHEERHHNGNSIHKFRVITLNVVKYLWRYQDKGGIEDLRKARWMWKAAKAAGIVA